MSGNSAGGSASPALPRQKNATTPRTLGFLTLPNEKTALRLMELPDHPWKLHVTCLYTEEVLFNDSRAQGDMAKVNSMTPAEKQAYDAQRPQWHMQIEAAFQRACVAAGFPPSLVTDLPYHNACKLKLPTCSYPAHAIRLKGKEFQIGAVKTGLREVATTPGILISFFCVTYGHLINPSNEDMMERIRLAIINDGGMYPDFSSLPAPPAPVSFSPEEAGGSPSALMPFSPELAGGFLPEPTSPPVATFNGSPIPHVHGASCATCGLYYASAACTNFKCMKAANLAYSLPTWAPGFF